MTRVFICISALGCLLPSPLLPYLSLTLYLCLSPPLPPFPFSSFPLSPFLPIMVAHHRREPLFKRYANKRKGPRVVHPRPL